MKNKITYAVVALSLLMLVVGCYSEKIAMQQTAKAHDKYPTQFTGLVMGWYPVHDSIVSTYEYLPGEPFPVPGPTKYVAVDCDSAKAAKEKAGDTSPNIVYAECPPNMIRVDTFKSMKETLRKNTIEIEHWKGKYMDERESHIKDNAEKDAKISQQANRIKNLWIAVGSLSLLILIFIAAKWLFKWI